LLTSTIAAIWPTCTGRLRQSPHGRKMTYVGVFSA